MVTGIGRSLRVPGEILIAFVAVIKGIQCAMPIEGANNLAMGTGRLLEPFRQGVPFVVAAAKPSLLAHGEQASEKSMIVGAWGRGGVVAGYEKNSFERGAR